MPSSNKKNVQNSAIIKFGIKRVLISISTLFEYNSPQAYKDCQKAIDNFRQSIMKKLEAISPLSSQVEMLFFKISTE